MVDDYHSGLAVRAADVPPGAWGARADFPGAGTCTSAGAIAASTWRRIRGCCSACEPPARRYRASETRELRLSEAGFGRLVAFVRKSQALDADGNARVLGPGLEGDASRFYAAEPPFHLLRNCNTWVAKGLEAAGIPVRSAAVVTAGSLLRAVPAAGSSR